MSSLTISGRRLMNDIKELATFGGREHGGVDRVAGSPEDLAARAWLVRRIEDAGLEGWTDATGNVFGRVRGSRAPWVLCGSHTDTVPAAGHLDGAYGTIAALEALRTLHEAGHPAAAAVMMVDFWDEEGVRPGSGGGLVGSTALRDSDSVRDIGAFVELHIEQGPRMEHAGLQLAVVDGIVGIDRYTVVVRGEANHAGTTPMDARADAGRAAARITGRLWEAVRTADETMVVNVGRMEFVPGSPNVIPGEACFVAELRAATQEALTEAERCLGKLVREICDEERCTARITQLSHKPVVRFDDAVRRALDTACRGRGVPVGHLSSFAGHDAGALSAKVPTGMLFVPSAGGVSHSPAEDTAPELLIQGAQVLLETVVELTGVFCHGVAGHPRSRH
ncbi:M20/M25/M40 family metallo-hydrolase [Streptomyces tsukubensis]|uniref:Zn-dependent hydrolase n=1 Tax=Streptomyces tsukubensis TaxID=83656 RepID=UPI0036B672F0